MKTQDTLAREHVSTHDTLAREHISPQGTLELEHVFDTQRTQFSRLQKILFCKNNVGKKSLLCTGLSLPNKLSYLPFNLPILINLFHLIHYTST